MASTKDDVTLSGSWIELYSAASVTPQSKITVFNKSATDIYVCISPTVPTSTTKGYPVEPFQMIGVDSGDPKVYAIGTGPILVQLA